MTEAINNASTTITTSLGFGYFEPVLWMKGQMLIVLGSALGSITVIWPFVLAFSFIVGWLWLIEILTKKRT